MTLFFEDIEKGSLYESGRRTITETDIVHFAGLSGDFNPLHMDEVFAREETPFGRRVAHGLLGTSVGTGLLGELAAWNRVAMIGFSRSFKSPIFPGDTVHMEYRVLRKKLAISDPRHGEVVVEVKLVSQAGSVLQTGEEVHLVTRRDSSAI